jgi:hypothetical protein
MEQRTKLLIGAGVIVVILLIITAAFFISRGGKTNNSNSLNTLTTIQDDGTVVPTPTPVISENSTTKTYLTERFSFRYPKNWGLLTCSNSGSIELDPTNSADSIGVACNEAVKPVTILVSDSKGSCEVGKKTWNDGQIDYRWCVNLGNTHLDITHRVSSEGFKATSKTDYSGAVEELIRTLSATPQGS